tara:strand:+ start:889 stop:1041 length:153 start_codon:yes stop_codon:yes gene_type:complete
MNKNCIDAIERAVIYPSYNILELLIIVRLNFVAVVFNAVKKMDMYLTNKV